MDYAALQGEIDSFGRRLYLSRRHVLGLQQIVEEAVAELLASHRMDVFPIHIHVLSKQSSTESEAQIDYAGGQLNIPEQDGLPAKIFAGITENRSFRFDDDGNHIVLAYRAPE